MLEEMRDLIDEALRQLLGFGGDDKVQHYSFDLVVDWLMDAVDQQKSWLYNYDSLGRIALFNHTKQQGPILLAFAEQDFSGFRMKGLVRGIDYEVPGTDEISGDMNGALRFIRIKSVDALKRAGDDLQNCIRNKPRDNALQVDYQAALRGGDVAFIALCGAQGEIHALMTIQNGMIKEVGGKQGVLPNKKYMDPIVDFANRHRLKVHDKVAITGLVKTQTGFVRYLDLVDPHRDVPLHIEGDLNLSDVHDVFNVHNVPFNLQNFQVNGHLIMHRCYVRSLSNITAETIAVMGCGHLGQIDTSVKAELLITDRAPKDLKLCAITPHGRTNIKIVKICDPLGKDPNGYTVVQRMTGEAYAELFAGSNEIQRQYAAKLEAVRPTVKVVLEDIPFPRALT